MLNEEYYSEQAIALRRRQRAKKKRRRTIIKFVSFLLLLTVVISVTVKLTTQYISEKQRKEKIDRQLQTAAAGEVPDWVDIQLIEIHSSARTGEKLKAVSNIIVHYVGNPGTTAQNNRDYFNSDQSNVSAHFVVGLKGEVIQCVPLEEKSSASNWANSDSISIEVCHPDETGQFNEKTYETLVKLTAWLCDQFELTDQDVIRHYDVTGKLCPLYYVEHEDEWLAFRQDIKLAQAAA